MNMSDPDTCVPIFPLNSVILPGGKVPLQLFEPRYIDMVSRCLKQDQGFVMALLQSGSEAGPGPVRFSDTGTRVRVADFRQLESGLLGITVEGTEKVSIGRSWQQADGLNLGDVQCLPPEPRASLPGQYAGLADVLRSLSEHPVIRELDMSVDYSDARHIGWRLTELLPLDRACKQELAELQDPLERLARLETLLHTLENE